MSRIAGQLRQIGLVVDDVDTAVTHFANTIGVGPFVVFRELVFAADYRYRGQAAPAPVVSIAIGHSGPLQIEIIQQHNDAPSAYRDYRADGREGMQHLSSWCETRIEFDSRREALVANGLEIIHEGAVEGMAARFAYFSAPSGGWPQIEISEALLPEMRGIPLALERLAANWNGRNTTIEPAALMAAAGERH